MRKAGIILFPDCFVEYFASYIGSDIAGKNAYAVSSMFFFSFFFNLASDRPLFFISFFYALDFERAFETAAIFGSSHYFIVY